MSTLLAVTIIFIIYLCYTNRTKYVTQKVNNREWNVVSGYHNTADAAHLINECNAKVIKVLDYMCKKYHIDETDDVLAMEGDGHQQYVNTPNDIHNVVAALVKNYNPDVFYENDPRKSSDTSYTINKGEAMYICARERKNPNSLESPDDLLFVMLHEASHIANYNGWQHDKRFWEIFKFVLHEAAEAGIYQPVDYRVSPIDYCGLYVDYNPYYDPNVRNLT